MNRPLKRDVVVRAHLGKPRKRWKDSLEINEAQRILQTIKFIREFWAHERLSAFHALHGPSLSLRQGKRVRNLFDQGDSRGGEFLHLACCDPGQATYVICGQLWVAMVIEFAQDGMLAVLARLYVGRLISVQNSKLFLEPVGDFDFADGIFRF